MFSPFSGSWSTPGTTCPGTGILLQLDKVGPKTAQKILVIHPQAARTRLQHWLHTGRSVPGKDGYTRLIELMLNLQGEHLSPAGQFDLLMEYYEPIFEKIYYDDYPKRKKEIDQLKALVAGYGDLQSLIDDTTLDPPESGQDLSAVLPAKADKLVLSTIHSAKGLEWDAVFVIGLAEGRFPHQNTSPGRAVGRGTKASLCCRYPGQEKTLPDLSAGNDLTGPHRLCGPSCPLFSGKSIRASTRNSRAKPLPSQPVFWSHHGRAARNGGLN